MGDTREGSASHSNVRTVKPEEKRDVYSDLTTETLVPKEDPAPATVTLTATVEPSIRTSVQGRQLSCGTSCQREGFLNY